jgi:hypothetical protein
MRLSGSRNSIRQTLELSYVVKKRKVKNQKRKAEVNAPVSDPIFPERLHAPLANLQLSDVIFTAASRFSRASRICQPMERTGKDRVHASSVDHPLWKLRANLGAEGRRRE